VWERDRIDPGIAVQLGRVAQCWVPCEQNRELLVQAGVEWDRVRVVPHPFDPASPLCRLTARRPVPTRRYYTIGRWEARKGQHELLGAFLREFRPGEASLVVKYTGGQWDGYPSPEQSVEHWLNGNRVHPAWTAETFARHVQLIGDRLPADQILKLHFTNNIYVSAGHGEAWCLPAFDAKVAGNRLVHVSFGGTADFAGPGDVAVLWHLGPVHSSYKWEPGAMWAEYEPVELAAALRAADPPVHHERPPQFEERFSMRAVGEQMLRNVLQVADERSPPAATYLRERGKI
jgi:glycosyltransferase involved in cell wall biosynthesis